MKKAKKPATVTPKAATTPPPADFSPPRRLFSVRQFCERNPAFPQPTIRQRIFEASPRFNAKGQTLPGNGLLECGAVLRCGRKVLIDEAKFYQWLDQKNMVNPAVKAA